MNALTFNALAEPNRLRIVELLRQRPLSVGEIAGRLLLRQPQTSKHLRMLSEAGIVTMRPVAKQRVYQLDAARFEEIDEWLDSFKTTWSQRFDNFDNYLQNGQ